MKIVIIEDEALAARRLSKLISEINPEIQIMASIQSVRQGIEWFSNNSLPDLVMADIQLSDDLSFEIFQSVQLNKPIIFTTAYDEYAINAFNYYSIDYLLKPIKKTELEKALIKYYHIHQPAAIDYHSLIDQLQIKKYKSRFLVYHRGVLVPIAIEDVAYFFSEDGMTFLVTNKGNKHGIYETLDKLEQNLDPSMFYRANRQYMISVKAVMKVHPYYNQKLKVDLLPQPTEEIIISKLKATSFKNWLNQ